MFKLANNKEIGVFLKSAIDKKYKSVRQFGKACLKEKNLPTDDESLLRNMSNRLSQILNGNKGIQLDDLPVFSKLLEMSCEEILSAGKSFAVTSSHLTNYYIATTANEKEWDEYIKREDDLILNGDEYGKTVIDYALEFKNYAFIKYLVDNKYIWFVGKNDADLLDPNFGAGTNIKRHPMSMRNMNLFEAKLHECYDLRIKMITLAIEHGDTKMLTELRAREIPPLYNYNNSLFSLEKPEKYYDEEMMQALATASDEILEYFSEEFEITDRFGRVNRFVFPFINNLIDSQIVRKNEFVQWMLKDAIAHNQYALDKITELISGVVDYYKEIYGENVTCESIKEFVKRYVDFFDDSGIVRYYSLRTETQVVTNIVQVKSTSDDVKIRRLIQDLNELYNKIQEINNCYFKEDL